MDPESLSLEELEKLIPRMRKQLDNLRKADIYQVVMDNFDTAWTEFEESLRKQHGMQSYRLRASKFLVESLTFVLRKHSMGDEDVERIFEAIARSEKARDFYNFSNFFRDMYSMPVGSRLLKVSHLVSTMYRVAMLFITGKSDYGSYKALRDKVSKLRSDKDPLIQGLVSDFEEIGLFPAKGCLSYPNAMEEFFSSNLALA